MDYTGLKVAFLHPRLEGGGAERVSLTTAELFASWGIKSYFIGATHNQEQFILPKSIDASIYCLPEQYDFHTEVNKEALRRFIDEEGISVAFVCYLDGSFFADRLGTHRCKFVYWCYAMPYWEYTYNVEAGEEGAKLSIRRWFDWYVKGKKWKVKSTRAYESVKANYLRDIETFDRYIVLCPEYREELIASLSLSPELSDRLVSMFNTITIEESPQLVKKKEIALVGRIEVVQKRFERMLYIWKEVMNKLPDWTLRVYGGGHDVWLLHKLIKELKLERVDYCGYVTDLGKIYNDSAVVCLTSTFEGWPMVLSEAQNNGCIPISFDSCAGVVSLLKDGAGCLVPSYDLNKYAEELCRICLDEGVRQEMQLGVLERRLDYHPHVNDETWKQLFESLLV